MPMFSQSLPLQPAPDFEYPYEPLVLALTAGWTRIAAADSLIGTPACVRHRSLT